MRDGGVGALLARLSRQSCDLGPRAGAVEVPYISSYLFPEIERVCRYDVEYEECGEWPANHVAGRATQVSRS